MKSGRRPSLGRPLMSQNSSGTSTWRERKSNLSIEVREILVKYKEWDNQRFSPTGERLLLEILRGSESITTQLLELEELARAADKKKLQLSNRDVMELKQFVVDKKNKMEDIGDAIRRARRVTKKNNRNDLFGDGDIECKKMGYGSDPVQQRRQLEAEQSAAMDGIDEKLGVLHGHATTVFTELEAQNKLIDELNDDVSEAQKAFDKVNAKLSVFLETTDRCQTTTACFLFAVLIGVLMLYAVFW